MGYKYSEHSDGEILATVGALDWHNHQIRLYDADARVILLSIKDAEAVMRVLPKAIADCKKANKEDKEGK